MPINMKNIFRLLLNSYETRKSKPIFFNATLQRIK